MARSIATIKAQILAEKANQSALNGLTSTSQSAIFNLWAFIIAFCINFLETLIDIKKTSFETTLANSIVPNDSWLQKKVFEFQYSSTTPQVTSLINGVPTYAIVDANLRIITRASVNTTASKTVTVKVAKSDPPVVLSAPELTALQGYLTQGGDGTYAGRGAGIGYSGVQIEAKSYTSDKVYLKATIYYDGQYNAVMVANVIFAINTYLATIPFDGNIRTVSLTDAIQAVAGVKDILIEDFAIRPDASTYNYLTQSFTQLFTYYPIFAGYAVEETNPGDTFSDTLTFVSI